MSVFLRALLSSAVVAVVTAAASAQTPAPPAAAPKTASAATTKPVVVANGACDPRSMGSGHNLSHGRLSVGGGFSGGRFSGGGFSGGRFNGSRLDALGARADQAAEAYIGFNERIGNFFSRLAGPPVDVAATPPGGQGHKQRGPYTQPGTVVFPQHPFVRSPRDFFMMEQP